MKVYIKLNGIVVTGYVVAPNEQPNSIDVTGLYSEGEIESFLSGSTFFKWNGDRIVDTLVPTKAPEPYLEFDYNIIQWIDPRNLEQTKSDKWEDIKKQRDAALYADLSYAGNVFDADPRSQQNIQGAVQMTFLYPEVVLSWTLADNTTITLNAEDIRGLGAILASRTESVYSKGRTLREMIQSATNSAEVNAITWDSV